MGASYHVNVSVPVEDAASVAVDPEQIGDEAPVIVAFGNLYEAP